MCYLLQAKLWLVLIIDMYVHESGSCWALPWLVGPTSIDELEHQQLAFFKDQKPQKSALRCTGALDLRVWLLTWTWPIYYFVWKYQPKPQSFGSGWWAEVQIYPVVLVSDQVHRLITWFAFFFFSHIEWKYFFWTDRTLEGSAQSALVWVEHDLTQSPALSNKVKPAQLPNLYIL